MQGPALLPMMSIIVNIIKQIEALEDQLRKHQLIERYQN